MSADDPLTVIQDELPKWMKGRHDKETTDNTEAVAAEALVSVQKLFKSPIVYRKISVY